VGEEEARGAVEGWVLLLLMRLLGVVMGLLLLLEG
jgi:hypothetical protein